MAVNLRLPPEIADALRERSRASGVSQQEILRRALERYLDDTATSASVSAGYRRNLIPARRPFNESEPRLVLPDGVSSLDLLDRDDRI